MPKFRTVFTKHAVDRLHQMGIKIGEGLRMFDEAIKEPKSHKDHKARKYGEEDSTCYKAYGQYLFVYKNVLSKGNEELISLVITVGDKLSTITYRDHSNGC